jgi:cbb3-type cytochrome oxidase cytochrome c subunit
MTYIWVKDCPPYKRGDCIVSLPPVVGNVKTPTFKDCIPFGLRELVEVEAAPEGYRVVATRLDDIDGVSAKISVAGAVEIAAEAEQAALALAAMEAQAEAAVAQAKATDKDTATWTRRERVIIACLKLLGLKDEDLAKINDETL